MRPIPVLALLAAMAVAAADLRPAAAQVEDLLLAAGSSVELRARLLECERDAEDETRAALCAFLAGESFARDGSPDSAIAAFSRAVAAHGARAQRLALAHALLSRAAPGDAERAAAVIRPLQPASHLTPGPHLSLPQGLLAWAHLAAGRVDSARVFYAPTEPYLSLQPGWRPRLARASLAAGDRRHALILLLPAAIASRGVDPEIDSLIAVAADPSGLAGPVREEVAREISAGDAAEAEHLATLGAHRLPLAADDEFPLGAVVFPSAVPGARLAAIVMVTPGDEIAVYDSLASALRHSGFAVLLLEPRGYGRSVGPDVPGPEAWSGRETAVMARVAADVPAAFDALVRAEGLDPAAGYLLVAGGATVTAGVAAAATDARVRALLLLSPEPATVERGIVRAGLAALRRPVFVQAAAEDVRARATINAFYRACDPLLSRIAEHDRPGRRARIFRRGDPVIFDRVRKWLDEVWPPAGRRVPRR